MIEPLDPGLYRDIVRRALDEDVGTGDVTTAATVSASQRARGVFLVKADCVLAGLDVAFEVFRQAAEKGTGVISGQGSPGVFRDERCPEMTPVPFFKAHKQDGEWCRAGEEIAEVTGSAAALLIAERTALNFLQRLSGIATRARRFVDAAGGRITVLDTRKTTPTLRVLEKYAVRAGGATNHRSGLYDAVLIKDNHIRLAGGVRRPSIGPDATGQTCRSRSRRKASRRSMTRSPPARTRSCVDNLPLDEIREAVGRARTDAR